MNVIDTTVGRGSTSFAGILRRGASATALCTMLLATQAYGQTAPPVPSDPQTGKPAPPAPAPTDADSTDIIVTGIRASLANAQNIKRNADTVVDAITAQDIGALPDRSVTEALQRVPGIAINRFAGSNDPDHFSVEGSGVNIRGLNFVRSEFNGRDTFSANGGQAINFADVPAELLGSVEIYKNATAVTIEGGLAGTVNLNTRKPFDSKGFRLAFDAEANYGDFEKKWSPTGSVLISNTWNTGIGRIGLLADISYSRVRSRADGIQVTNFQLRNNTGTAGSNGSGAVCRNPLPSSTDTTTLPAGGSPCGTASTPGADGFADLRALSYAPIGGQFRSQDFDRKRDGQAFAAQWESSDAKELLTFQFLRTNTTNAWGEHTFESGADLSEYNTYPKGCQQNTSAPASPNGDNVVRAECPVGGFTNYTYDSNGLFQSGYITQPGTGYRSSCSPGPDCNVPTGGTQQSLSRRQVFERNTNMDYGLNLKIKPSDRWSIELDADYTYSKRTDLDFSVFGSTFADSEVNLAGTLPVVIPHKPLTLSAAWAAPNTRLAGESDSQYFNDANVQFWRAAMDHAEDSSGSEYALKGDFAYKFDEGSFMKDVRFGARYSERNQTIRSSTYNWGVLSEVWAGAGPVSLAQSGLSQASFYSFPNFFRGQTPGPVGGYYYNGDLINGYGAASTYFKSIGALWNSANGAGQSGTWRPLAERAGVVPGTQYLPSEIQKLNQQDYAAYVQLNFGSSQPLFGNIKLSGNIGLRYAGTNVSSVGSIGIPTQSALGIQDTYAVRCAPQTIPGPPGGPPITTVPGGVCTLGAAGYANLQQFATGQTTYDAGKNNYSYFLPSINLKFGVTNNVIIRFAGSKVLTRPDSSYIRNFLQIGYDQNANGLTATAGNPFLKPATAWQFDMTAEWYFAKVGSLTVDFFYKSVHNFFYSSVFDRTVSSSGGSQIVQVRGPANYNGYGKIKGVEISYQQTFDFLPGFLKGFGTNLNYSYIDSSGLPNAFLNGGSPSSVSNIIPGNLPLEGLSKHNFNATIFFERGPISLRAAYNWRSRFLLTASDVIFPYTSIFNDSTGQLDASAFINIGKNIKIGVQGVNLTNEVTKTLQAYSGDSTQLAPRSYFANDRRFSFIIRGNF